jgi:hypothetical protein
VSIVYFTYYDVINFIIGLVFGISMYRLGIKEGKKRSKQNK